jgi:hypothetical protein
MAKNELKTVAEIISDVMCRPAFITSVTSGQYYYDIMLVAAKPSCEYCYNDPDAATSASNFK